MADSGPGSLRYGLEKLTGPRIIVFEVGGIIELKSPLRIPAGKEGGCVWIAGQSAPSPAVTVRIKSGKAALLIENSNVVVQNIRFRGGRDCVCIGAADVTPGAGKDKDVEVANVTLDYCSMGCPSAHGNAVRIAGADNVTVQRSLICGDYTHGNKLPYPSHPGSRTGVQIEGANRVTLWANTLINAPKAVEFKASSGNEYLEVVSTSIYNCNAANGAMITVTVPEGVTAKVRVAGCFIRPLFQSDKFVSFGIDQSVPEADRRSIVWLSGVGTAPAGELKLLARDNLVTGQRADFPLAQAVNDTSEIEVHEELRENDGRCRGPFSAPVLFDNPYQNRSIFTAVGGFSNSNPYDPIDGRMRIETQNEVGRALAPNDADPEGSYRRRVSTQYRPVHLPEDPFTASDANTQQTKLAAHLNDPQRFPVVAVQGLRMFFDKRTQTWFPHVQFPAAAAGAGIKGESDKKDARK